MREGDLLYCKKTYISTSTLGKEEWITKGKSYKVVYDKEANVYSIIDNQDEINNTILYEKYMKKYFYTNQEYRKIKLQKINESSLHTF